MGTRRFHGPSDLHLHSNCSDGTEPPEAVVAAAHRFGLGTIALTDHDTTDGWAAAAAASAGLGMTLIPGMEFSTRHGERSVHVLAYLFDPHDPDLVAELSRIREARLGRAERIVAALARDYRVSWEDVVAQTTDGATVGRPHIADALVANGVVVDRAEAFAGVLHPREGYYRPHYAPDPVAAVDLIVAAGGVPVIAHPAPAGRGRMLPLDYLDLLVEHGLAGLELGHRENTAEGREVLAAFAAQRDLIVTGSSDYHGSGKPNLPGEFTTADAAVERILERGHGSAPVFA